MYRVFDADIFLFRRLNDIAGSAPPLDAAMVACARFAPWLLAVLLVVLCFVRQGRCRHEAFLAGAAAAIALGVGQLIGMALPRLRPYEALSNVHLLITHAPDTSFPSDHATLAFAIAVVFVRGNRMLGGWLLALGCWLCVARVYVGAHYPSDVIGGALLGSAVGVLVLNVGARQPAKGAIDNLVTLFGRLEGGERLH